MAKRVSQSNTLLNYFQSPKGKVTPKKSVENGVSKKSGLAEKHENEKKVMEKEDSDEEIQRPSKRCRTALLDSDSESENESPNTPVSKKLKSNGSSTKKHKLDSSEEESESISKKSLLDSYEYAKSEKKIAIKEEKTPKKCKDKRSKETILDSRWVHEQLPFLKPENIRDAQKRKSSDPDYDHRTLYIPPDYLNTLTPAMRQWWILKSQYLDTVLFFKVGKFYELYHMDAVVGVQELGFSFMKGEFAHSGFPESAYGKMANMLVDKGYSVARVEQTETPEMMAERCKKQGRTTKFDKVVARELCQVTTKASCIYGAQMPEARSEFGCYMYAIAAKVNNDGTCRFGVTFVDTSIGTFYISEFDDDKHCSTLLALFAEYLPGLILTERGANYGTFKNLLNSFLKDVKQDTLASKSQFYAADQTLEKFYSECYFKDKDGKFTWPNVFKDIADECLPKPEFELALRSLGACQWFLKHCELDIQVFSMGHFELYNPLDIVMTNEKKHIERDYMVLDSTTIQNLNLLGGNGSLQKTLDFCKTAFGKRLVPQWICRPLCNIDKIKSRQYAIKELYGNQQKLKATQDLLKKLPDLERQVAKIHIYGNRFCLTNHPDGRAIFYEAKTYSKRKIMDLIKTLKGFELSQEIAQIFKGCESRLLRKITQFVPDGMNLDLSEDLTYFKEAFNHAEAEKEGTIIPKSGVDEDYDAAEEAISEINKELQRYLKEQSHFFGCNVTYFGAEKKRFQLDVPENRASRADGNYQLEGTKKGAKPAKRFSTSVTRELLHKMLKAEAERNKIVLDLNRRIFEKFSRRYDQWQQGIHCLAILDVLCSLAEYATSYSGDVCQPNVEPFLTQPFISIENGKHPCVPNMDNFVPNDTTMGTDSGAPLLLLTGPNMGGKSTLMRQVSTICIMAQIGSFVPASQCSLSLIDRVFTRLGACDDIVRGQSTFFVELSEASTILRHASKQSLLIVDELGRGTSTHDGNAIATAYVRKLIEMKCRTLFSTHYHTLVDHFDDNKDVQLGHMACMVENDDDPTEESVTLLYKLAAGRCPKSFGFNAARLAGLPTKIVTRGRGTAKEIEMEDVCRHAISKVIGQRINVEELRRFIGGLQI